MVEQFSWSETMCLEVFEAIKRKKKRSSLRKAVRSIYGQFFNCPWENIVERFVELNTKCVTVLLVCRMAKTITPQVHLFSPGIYREHKPLQFRSFYYQTNQNFRGFVSTSLKPNLPIPFHHTTLSIP